MKQIFNILVFFTFFFGWSSCRKVQKDVYDYYPEVKTVSVTVLSNGSVEVTGELISEGAAPLEHAGFCVSTNPLPNMLEGQAFADNTFSAVYSGFSPGTKYYFRSWATNAYGYSYGNVISLDSVVVPNLTAPCTPTMNSINIGGGNPTQTYYNVDVPTYSSSGWDFQALSSSNTVNFRFGSELTTKIYTTTAATNPSSDQVRVNFYSGSLSGTLSAGSSVYVNQTGSNTWEITICSAPWTYSSSTFYLTTKFTCPL